MLNLRHKRGLVGDNSGYDYDEAIIKGITADEFNKILDIAEKFEKQQYCLFDNNCTDFGLQAAEAVGINLPDAQGKIVIPMGGSNDPKIAYASNPVDLGKDLNENKASIEKQGATIIVSGKDDSLQATNMNTKKK